VDVMTARRVIGDRYEVGSLLGRGGTASVWLARDCRLDRSVAIKELTGRWLQEPTALERFDRAARMVGGLDHPNIVAVHDVDIHGVIPYLVMELIEGVTVAQILRNGVLTVGQAVAIAAQTCAGLSAAHAAGVIHGDIKPANLMLTPAGVVKICDFGIARALSRTGDTEPRFVGTTRYLAPEQARGEHVDARADLYGLGCTLYAMLIGVPPFSGVRADELWQHLDEKPVGLRVHRADVPAPLDALVAQLLAKAAADRPYDAADVKARLADLVNDLPTGSTPLPPALPPSRGGPVPLMSGRARGQARVVPSRVNGPRHASRARTRRIWHIGVAGLILLAAIVTWMFVAG
jgi:eukaryotic-like serine/threonine-protein kinase